MNIKILQLDHSKMGEERFHKFGFSQYKTIDEAYPNKTDLLKFYTQVYEIVNYQPETMDTNEHSICEDIFVKFNMKLPSDFEGRSLSMSDIILVNDKRYYYVDAIGFKMFTIQE